MLHTPRAAGALLATLLCAVAAVPAPVAPPPRVGPLAAAKRFADKGMVDRFVATSAGWDRPADDPRVWQPVLDLAQAVADRTGYGYWGDGKGIYFPFGTVETYRAMTTPSFYRTDRPHRQRDRNDLGEKQPFWPEGVIATELTSPVSMWGTAAVVRGPVRVGHAAGVSIVLANGDVTIGDYCGSTMVLVADGDVDIGDRFLDALVVARGNVRVRNFVRGGVLVAGGRVTVDKPFQNEPEEGRAVIRENDPNPFGWVSWFELAQAGVAAETADGGVAVTKVADGKPFAAAGVRKGDLVVKVGDHPVGTPEEFRRRVRDAHALTAEATIHLRRDGQALTVRVPLPH
ncbi:MAG: PDZ domain-containing protein [Gemmataceae bacterium]|nr:PDZ domain-containing protein [Gemmataceae bacterium]